MKPRIIGIIILALAITAYFFKISGAKLLAVIGAILIISPTKHSQEMLKLCIQSIKRWKTIILTALYDAVFWLITAGILFVFIKWESLKSVQAQATIKLTSEALIQTELLQQNVSGLQSFLIYSLIAGLIVITICLAIYTISRALIWTNISKQKLTKKFFLKFLGLNAIWWLIWLPIYFLIGVAAAKAGTKIVILLLFAITAYFTPILHTLFTKKQLIGHSLGHGIAYGITKFYKLIVPITYALIIYIIIYQPFRLLQNTKFYQAATILLVVIYLAWLRTYLYEAIKKFE